MQIEKTQSEKLFEVKNVEQTIFSILRKDSTYQIIIGNQIVTNKTFKTEDEAANYIESKPWELILIACHLYSNHINKLQDNQRKHDKNQIQ